MFLLVLKNKSVRGGQIRDSQWKWNSDIDYSSEEVAGDLARKIQINEVSDFKRDRRQIEYENDGELTTEEPLLVEDPKGWGLAHILGIISQN